MQDNTKQTQEVMAKRTAKNSVFLDLFQNKSYLLKLYQTLHPEDITATEDSLTDVTIENVLTDNLYNDLGFIVNNRLLILIEAQSTWTMNILVRVLLYLAQSYHEYFQRTSQNYYKSKKVSEATCNVSTNISKRIADIRKKVENLLDKEWEYLKEGEITVFGMYITWTRTMEGFQVYSEFDKPETEPTGLNRHWIAHGRKTTIATKLDCCKMINALYGLLYFGNPILPMP